MKKKDIVLFGVIIFVAFILMVFIKIYNYGEGKKIRVYVNGEVYGEYSLNEKKEIEINTKYGKNILVIENDYAFMKFADCKDGYCVKQGKIKLKNQTIVCLPHKLVIKVVSEGRTKDKGKEVIPDDIVK